MWCGCCAPSLSPPGCWLPADCAHRPSIKLIAPQSIHPGSSSQLQWWLMLHLSLVYLCSSDSVIYISWPIPAFISSLLCSRTTLTSLHACSQTRHLPAVSKLTTPSPLTHPSCSSLSGHTSPLQPAASPLIPPPFPATLTLLFLLVHEVCWPYVIVLFHSRHFDLSYCTGPIENYLF